MDIRTGRIISPEEFNNLPPEERAFYVSMQDYPTKEQMERKPPRVNYNEPCPCGSGKPFRKCCFSITRRKDK